MQIVGIEEIYKFLLFQAIFPHHVDCKLIDGKEIYLKLNSHHQQCYQQVVKFVAVQLINLGPVQRSIFSCTECNYPFQTLITSDVKLDQSGSINFHDVQCFKMLTSENKFWQFMHQVRHMRSSTFFHFETKSLTKSRVGHSILIIGSTQIRHVTLYRFKLRSLHLLS